MAEELQHLIDKIQTEAVDKADRQAAEIVSQAKEKAASIVSEAESKAADYLKKAEKDAEAFTQRSAKTLEQAARDLLITVGQGVENILSDIVADEAGKTLDADGLKDMIGSMIEAYIEKGDSGGGLDVLLSEADQKKLVKYFKDKYATKLKGGLELHAGKDILSGFQVSFKEGKVYHDFTGEAIAEALSAFLRPHLSEIVHRVAQNGSK
ncbi:MAG: ATPase [Verrucomicrobia bacterium]|nr:ATPase [Verrucomicrobiota bacterium]